MRFIEREILASFAPSQSKFSLRSWLLTLNFASGSTAKQSNFPTQSSAYCPITASTN
jgi:hypothetical protein